MKIITWNCQGAFRKKAEFILGFQPDILIVQECEHLDKLVFNSKIQQPNHFLWFGDNKNKGLGIFSYGEYKFQVLDEYSPEFKIVIPISVSNQQFSFTLFAIWANNPIDKNNRYIEQVWNAITNYDNLITTDKIILTGDFNSNKIWDKKHRVGNHSAVVDILANKNIFSIYHNHLQEDQGKESIPTFYLHRNKNKPYHIDYCFASQDILNKLKSFEVGSYEKWIPHSDHSPLIVEFSF